MKSWALLRRPIGELVNELQRPSDALDGQVELIVRRVEVVEDQLEGRIGVDIVTEADEQAMDDIEEDRHFIQVVSDR